MRDEGDSYVATVSPPIAGLTAPTLPFVAKPYKCRQKVLEVGCPSTFVATLPDAMRDAVAAIEAALKELIDARSALPDEFAGEIDQVITQTQILLDSLQTQSAQPSETE